MTNSVAIVMGSKSDMALAEATKEVLDGYETVSYTHLTLPTI